MLKKGRYVGFSSFEFQSKGTFKIVDVELVKLDLLNHIFTRRGDRIMMPTFGTRIPDMVFEPLDEETLDIIRTDLQAVFDFDPRVRLLELEIVPAPNENAVTTSAKLQYIELNIVDTMNINIELDGGN